MKCQIPFSGKNKKNVINLSSAVLAQRVVKIKGNGYTFRRVVLCQNVFAVLLKSGQHYLS